MYGRVYAEPATFGPEIALYEELFAGGRLLAEFDPCVLDCWLGRRGPTIRVVQIR